MDQAETFQALAVDLECQGWGRVDACTFVRGQLDGLPVVTVVPRAKADVVLYLDVTQRNNDDLWLLRATSSVDGWPADYEQIATVDYRWPVDEQQVAFEAPLARSLAPYVALKVPEAVTVTMSVPDGAEEEERRSTPYGFVAWLGGWGSWTPQYQYASLWSGMSAYRVTPTDGAGVSVSYERNIEVQPDLSVDGADVSLAYDSEELTGLVHGEGNLDEHWTVGMVARGGHQDEDGQFDGTLKVHAGVERNWFASDDARGNRLAAAYLIGVQADAYQRTNVLGEDYATFPTHMVLLQGDVQFDTVSLSLDLAAQAELLKPDRRYVLSADAGTDLVLGSNLDLYLSFGVTQQAIPGPAALDQADFEQVKRASYAEPLQMYGNFNIRIHFDPSNGVRNNRFDAAVGLDGADNL
ncbi:MAG: hypothetical protein H6738_06300 [Alphaproteobacteria bacterium]|nr:hypothetical protein [Alphaproteobacteria bacterium]